MYVLLHIRFPLHGSLANTTNSWSFHNSEWRLGVCKSNLLSVLKYESKEAHKVLSLKTL